MQKEPAVIIATLTAAIIAVVRLFIDVPPDVESAIIVVLVFVAGLITRAAVYAPATVAKLTGKT